MTPERLSGLMELSELAARCAAEFGPSVSRVAAIIAESIENKGKVLVCGNGGSAADAQHFVAELVGRFTSDSAPLAAVSLSSDPSISTAISNDFGFREIFARQIQALGRPGDVVVVISTSGRSENIVRAVEVALSNRMKCAAFLGEGGDQVFETCHEVIHIPSNNPQRIQEIHTAVLHAVCERLEEHREANS